jgi:hypothetical protein
MALVSFWFLIVACTAILGTLLLSSARVEVAQALNTAAFTIGGLLAMPTAIVLAYLGVSLTEQIFKQKG